MKCAKSEDLRNTVCCDINRFLVLAILAYHESARLLREAEKASGLTEKLELWFRSALYMLMFTVFILMFFAFALASMSAIYKGEKDSRVWVR
jgi:hypothetical protein